MYGILNFFTHACRKKPIFDQRGKITVLHLFLCAFVATIRTCYTIYFFLNNLIMLGSMLHECSACKANHVAEI